MKKILSKTARTTALGLGVALGLAGCGGGGGDAGAPMNTPQGNGLAISASNYTAVAQSAVSSMGFLGDTSGLVTGAEVASKPQFLPLVVDQAKRGLARLQGGGAVLSGVQTSEVVPCSQGGTLTLVINDVGNNGSLDAGDGLTIDASACIEQGVKIQGRIALQVQALTGVYDSSNYSATVQMTLTAFVATTGSDTAQGDGTITVTLARTPAGVTDIVLDVPTLTLSGTEAGQSYSTKLTGVHMALRNETVSGAARTSLTYTGTLTSSAFGNRDVLISTPQTLVVQGSDAFPSSGQLMVSGSSGSKIRLTAMNKTQVKLELDADGDGAYETQATKTWLELQ
jgi:hypothetical protein